MRLDPSQLTQDRLSELGSQRPRRHKAKRRRVSMVDEKPETSMASCAPTTLPASDGPSGTGLISTSDGHSSGHDPTAPDILGSQRPTRGQPPTCGTSYVLPQPCPAMSLDSGRLSIVARRECDEESSSERGHSQDQKIHTLHVREQHRYPGKFRICPNRRDGANQHAAGFRWQVFPDRRTLPEQYALPPMLPHRSHPSTHSTRRSLATSS